jgi:HTH-type transcriptional regulator/antitoxin HigA
MKQWLPINSVGEYREAVERLEEIYDVDKNSPFYREMLLLSLLVNDYEKKNFEIPQVDPIEMIKIRMEDFGYTATELSKAYGDKGTISKVLNYKQALSLTMIRKFSKLLRISADLLVKEYKLRA